MGAVQGPGSGWGSGSSNPPPPPRASLSSWGPLSAVEMAPGWGGCAARGEHSRNWWKTPTEPHPAPPRTSTEHVALGWPLAGLFWQCHKRKSDALPRLPRPRDKAGRGSCHHHPRTLTLPYADLGQEWPVGSAWPRPPTGGQCNVPYAPLWPLPLGPDPGPAGKQGRRRPQSPQTRAAASPPLPSHENAGRYTGDRSPGSWLGPQCWLLLSQL